MRDRNVELDEVIVVPRASSTDPSPTRRSTFCSSSRRRRSTPATS
jgi:hypothetical protein